MKAKKCKHCGEIFTPERPMQSVCNQYCANGLTQSKKIKTFKAETKVMKKALADTDRALWIKKAQKACNDYIRERDKANPCISCGRHHNGQYHAGHFIPAGRGAALRFDERNIFKQCAPCNSHLSGNISEYRKSLIMRLGVEVVEWLESNHDVKKWTIEELKEIERTYKVKLRELKDKHG